jgi:chromosomal replication initiation ATPase DnaA
MDRGRKEILLCGKVCAYLTARLMGDPFRFPCDRTLPEIAGYFGIASYATVSWNCRTIGLQIAQNKKFRDLIERIAATIIQP